MSNYIGRKVAVGIGKESSRGTAVTPSYWVQAMEVDIGDKITQAIDSASVGVIVDADDATLTQKYSEGTVASKILDKSFGLWLLATFGTDTPVAKAAPNAAVYDHTFTLAQSAQHQSLTVALKSPDEDICYPLSVIDSMEINVELDKYAEYSVSFRGKSAEADSNTVAYVAENHFIPKHASFKIATNLAGLTGASAIAVKKATITFTKNVEDDLNFGSDQATDILNKQFAVEGSVELLYGDLQFKTALLADTPKAMRLDLQNTDVTIGTSANPGLQINLARVKFSEVAIARGNDDLVRQTVSFKGFYSIADSSVGSVVLTNTVAAY